MIRLTRLRQSESFYVNPDHIERIEHHHDTNVHLFNGNEYVVTERPDEIVESVLRYRARILALASRLAEGELAGRHGDAGTA
jgi:flagellar protein FlbD